MKTTKSFNIFHIDSERAWLASNRQMLLPVAVALLSMSAEEGAL